MANGTRKSWTFLVYMSGENDLEPEGVADLREMKKVGSTDAVNVVAQFDRPSGSTRYLLRKGTSLPADATASLGPTNMGDPAALVDFVKWGASTHPAERYALVLWNHGQGWDDTDIYAGERSLARDARRPRRLRRALFRSSVVKAARLQAGPAAMARAILLDDGAKDFLDNLEMKQVLSATRKLLGRKLDLLGMDACLMSMAEVGYQARGSVAYLVGSEQTEPGGGWPYDRILADLAAKPGATGEALGRRVVQRYLESYRGSGEAVTQSLLDLASAPALARAVKPLAGALRAAIEKDAARLAVLDVRSKVQSYDVRDNVDLVDLCQLLDGAKGLPADVKQAARGVVAAVVPPAAGGAFVAASGSLGATVKHSSGVAIYFPTLAVSPLYARLDWARASGWGAFLEDWVAASRSR